MRIAGHARRPRPPGSGTGVDAVVKLVRLGQPTTASTSRAERIRYSLPEYLTSVPPYLE